MIKNFINRLTNTSPEKLFLYFSIPVVTLFIFSIPILQGWDEGTHFLRAYQISEGDLLPNRYGNDHAGDKTPVDIIQMHDAAVGDLVASSQSGLVKKASLRYYLRYTIDNHPSKERIEKYFEGSAVYSPISYAPQSLGIFLARSLQFPLISYVFIGRIMNAAFYLLLIYFAIKSTRRARWVILAVALLPTSLTAAASLSPDAIVIAASLLLVSQFIKALTSDKRISTKTLLIVLATIVTLSLVKQTYFVFGFLFLFLPVRQCFGSFKRYLSWNALFILSCLGFTLLWYAAIKDVANLIAVAHKPGQHINSIDQTHYIASHILSYLMLVSWELIGRINPIYVQLTGFLTWKGILLPQFIIFTSYLGLVVSFLITSIEEDKKHTVKKIQQNIAKIGPVLLVAAMTFLIYTSLYLTFTVVGADKIDGVQGRYFIPLIALLAPIFVLINARTSLKTAANKDFLKRVTVTIILLQNIAAIIVVVATNYIPGIQFRS